MATVAGRSNRLKSFEKFRCTPRINSIADFLSRIGHDRHIRRRDIWKVPERILNACLDLAQFIFRQVPITNLEKEALPSAFDEVDLVMANQDAAALGVAPRLCRRLGNWR
jgi:hypothetical protein